MTTEKPCNPHPDAPHGFVRNASHSVGHYVCECSGWTPPASIQEELRSGTERSRTTLEAAERIDALEAEIQILTAEREVYAATADRAIAEVESLKLRNQELSAFPFAKWSKEPELLESWKNQLSVATKESK